MTKRFEPSSKALVFQKLIFEAHKLTNKMIETRTAVLRHIFDNPLTVPQIARMMNMHRQNIQVHADRLVKERLCVFEENFFHNKSQLLRLTKKGVLEVEKEIKIFEKHVQETMGLISTEELTKVMLGLESLND